MKTPRRSVLAVLQLLTAVLLAGLCASLATPLTVTSFAGSGVAASFDGTGTNAGIGSPRGLAIEPSTGDLVVSTDGVDHQLVRVSTPGAVVSWWLGAAGIAGFLDVAVRNLVLFSSPTAVAVTPWHRGWAADGDVLVADSGNSKLRKVTHIATVG
jgi:hypothetical protein